MSNLRLIKEVSPASGVHSVNLTDVFTNDFNTYQITVSNLIGDSTTASGCNLRFINSSGTVVSTNYIVALHTMKPDAAFTEYKQTNTDKFFNTFGTVDDNPETSGASCYVFNPTKSDTYTSVIYQSSASFSSTMRGYKGIGILKQEGIVTGFQVHINESAVDFDAGGSIKVFGLRVD